MESTQVFVTGPQSPRLRELTGHDERAVERTDSGAAIELIARLAHAHSREQAVRMTAFERDRALAGVFLRLYGDRVESTLKCAACAKPFDISFSLQDLMGRQSPDERAAVPAGDGTFRMEGGLRFRLPTGEDEIGVLHLSAREAVHELLRRCVLEAPEGFGQTTAAAVQDAMEQVAPILDVDINTSCPECGTAALVRFDLQTYLLQSILQDRRRLWRETHVLATTYKWNLEEIHGLTRTDRRVLISMIEADASRRGVA
jgi:hypothetical protein